MGFNFWHLLKKNFIAVFNNMRTLKFKPQPTVTFFLPSIKFPAVSDDCRACSLTWQGESAFIMADESVGSLATQSPTTQLQSFAEDSV